MRVTENVLKHRPVDFNAFCRSGVDIFIMRVACLVKRWEHHTASGGYDRLAYEIGSTVFQRNELRGITSKFARKIWNRSTNTGAYLLDYRFEDWLAELGLLARCQLNPPDVVHVLYGDEQLDLLLRRRKLLRCPLIASFHLPAARVVQQFEHFQSQEIKGIDAAIVLARSEVAKFQHWFGAEKVIYVPHGIDTTKFRPDDDPRTVCNKLRLLSVGVHMRDWDVMHRTIDEAHRAHLDIQFDVVANSEFFPYFTGCSNVILHSEIPESQLIELYRSADALFLPVTSATGSNAVLEALACGVPVIATDVGGMPDYVTGDCGWLIPRGDVHSAVSLIQQLSVNKDIARSRREWARTQALKFDWHRIAERLSIVYSAVHAGQSPSVAVKEFEQASIGPTTALPVELDHQSPHC